MEAPTEPAASAVPSQPSRSTSAQAQPRVSFSESLQNKLPIGSRFAIVGPAASAAATDDASSMAAQEAPKSAASTMHATPTGPEITAEENPRMASLHVKFSASTRFNASDAESMLVAAGLVRPSGVIRMPSGQGSAQSDQEQGPWSGLRRALSGRHRRGASADSGGSYRHSSSGGRLSASSRSSNGTRRSISSLSQQSSPASSPAQSSNDDLGGLTLRGGIQGRRRRGRGRFSDRDRSPMTGYSSSDGGGQRNGRSGPRRPGVIRSLFNAAFSGPSPGSRRSRSAPTNGGGRGRGGSPLGFLRRSRSMASGLEDSSDQGGRPSRGLRWGRSRRRTTSESEGEPTRVESRREARRAAALQRRSLSRSRSRSRGRLPESGDERRGGSPSEGENPLLSFFGLGRRPRPRLRGQSSDSGGDSGRFRSNLRGRSRMVSPDGGQPSTPRLSRFLSMGSSARFSGAGPQQGLGGRAVEPEGPMSLAFRTELSEGEDAGQPGPSPYRQPQPQPPGQLTGRLEARRPPQLDLPPRLTRPPTFALRPSFGGAISSLPALPFVASPAFGTLAGQTAAQAPHRYQSQRQGSPQQQQLGGPVAGGPPLGAPAAPSMRRQQTGMRPPRALSRPRRAESAPRSRAAQRRAERAELGGGSKPRSMSARRHIEADPNAPRSFAAQRRQRKTSASGGASSETSIPAAHRLGSLFSRLLGRRPQAGASTNPSPERPATSPPATDITTPVLSPSPTPSLLTPRLSNISAADSLPASTTGASPAPGPGAGAPITTAPSAVPSAPAAAPPAAREAAVSVAPSPTAGPGQPSAASQPPGISPAQVKPHGMAGGTTPGPSASGSPTGDLRDSPLMQIPPGPVRMADRPRPKPLQIPNDPRVLPPAAPRIEAAPRPGQTSAAAAAAATGAGSAADRATAVASGGAAGAAVGMQPADGAAGASAAPAGATPEKARKGGWSQLGRVFGAMLPSKWLSPSKAAQTQEAPHTATSASAVDLVREGAGGLAFSVSELPRPAFPVPRPTDAGEGGPAAAAGGLQAPAEAKTEGPPPEAAQQEQPGRDGAAERAGDPLLRESPFMQLAQEAFMDDSTGAGKQTTRTKTRKGRHGRASSEVPSRLPAAAVAMGPMGQRPATAGSALPGLVVRAPANLPIGRSISPLGRSMAATGGGAGVVPPVVMLAPLAAAAQRSAIVSPLRMAHRTVAGAVTAATTSMTIRPGSAPWGVDRQSVLISVDRPAGIDSVLHPAPGARALSPPRHLPRPPRPHPGLPYTGNLLPPPTDISVAVDPSAFPAGVPGPPLEPPAAGYDLPAGSQSMRPAIAWPMSSQQAQPQQLLLPPQSPTRATQGREPGHGQDLQVMVEFPAGGPMAVQGQRPAAQVQVPVRSLRTPLALGLRPPGVGLMLSQAPEGVRAVAGAEAIVRAEAMSGAAALVGAAGLGPAQGTGLPGVRMAWGETVLRGAQPPPAPVMGLPPLTTAGLRPLPLGGLPRGSLLAAPSPTEEAVVERSWRGAADGVMLTAAGPIADVLAPSMAMGRSQIGSVGQLPATTHGRHRPLWLGRKPAEPYPPLQRPGPGPLLGPDVPYTALAAAVPGLPPGTADVLQPRMQPRQAPAFLGGAGGVGGGDDHSSSLASSTTVDSLRAASPLLATEQRRRELLLAQGPAGTGVSGVTVRTLQREVTAGPHVKLMKPKQLLRGLQPPGPSPAFTRRQSPFVNQEQQAQKEEPGESPADEDPRPARSARASDVVAGADVSAVATSGAGDASGEESRGPSTGGPAQRSLPLPDEQPAAAPGGGPEYVTQVDAPEADLEPPVAAAAAGPSGDHGGVGGFSGGRMGVDARTYEGETGRRGDGARVSPLGVVLPGPTQPLPSPRGTAGSRGEPPLPASMEPPRGPLLWGQATYDDQENTAPGDPSWGRMPASLVRVDRIGVPGVRTLVASPLANRLSPPRLLRVPSALLDHQPTRRHLDRGFSDVANEPRFLNVRLMRVLGPPAQPSPERPGERPPPQLHMRKLRVLERPDGEMPGIVPAGTAGRTEHLLSMLRQPVERSRATAGIGQRMGLFDRTSPPQMAQRDAAESPTRHNAAVQHSSTTDRKAVQNPAGPREALDATTQSGPASPQIDIHVHTVTTATGSAAPTAAAPPPVEPYPYPYYQPAAPPPLAAPASSPPPPPPPPAPAGQQQQQQYLAPQVVVAAADPGALAGLSALSQLTALTSLAGLSAAAGTAPGMDDPSLWPDLMETTPEALRQVSENTALRWRLQRPALAQANTAVLRDMDPELQLEPDQMLGPGLPGDAQQAMRGGVFHGGPAGAPLVAHGDTSRSVDGRVLGVGRATAKGRRLQGGEDGGGEGVSQREEERRRRRRGKAELEAEEGHDGARRGGGGRAECKGQKRERRRRDRRRRRRRRRSSSTSSSSSSGSESEDDGGSSSSSGSTPSKASTSSSSSESSGKRGSRKKKTKSGAKDKKERHKAPGPTGNATAPVLEPQLLGPRQPQPQQPQPWLSQAPAAVAGPEPGEDFGMDVAERLLRRMTEEPLGRPSSLQRRATGRSSSGTRSLAEARGASAAPGGGDGVGPVLQGSDVDDEDGVMPVEAASPPSGRRLTDGALDRPPADPRDSSSPHARMVDVLHGPDTERRTQEILARQDALRAKFLAAADNLRAAVAAAGPPASQHAIGVTAAAHPTATPPPPLPSAQAGAAQLAPGHDNLAAEPTLSQMPPQAPSSAAGGPTAGAAAAAVAAGSQAVAASGTSTPGPTAAVAGRALSPVAFDAVAAGFHGGSGTAVAGAAPGQLQVGGGSNLAFHPPTHPPTHQAINIYCTQLVLNPGRGPITVPGLPAYYPAPGPAAWGGVPMAVPTSPPPYPGQHYADGGYARDPQQQPDRAYYVRPAHTPPRSYPPAVHVSPTGTAAWLPPSRLPGTDGATLTQPSPSSSPPKPAVAQGPAPSDATGAGAAPSLSRDTQRGAPSHAVPGRITKVKPATQVDVTPALQVLPPEPSSALPVLGGFKAAKDAEHGSQPESVPTSRASSVEWQGSNVSSRDSQQGQGSNVSSSYSQQGQGSNVSSSDSQQGQGQVLLQGSKVASSGQATGEGAADDTTATDGGRQSAQGNTGAEAAEGEQQPTRSQQQAKLAAELSQLIMEAFQQSGGVIRPANVDTIRPSPGADDDATSGARQHSSPGNPRVPSQMQQQPSGPQRPERQDLGAAARPGAAAAAGGGGGSNQPPAFLTDAYSGSISDTLPAPHPPPAPAGTLPPPAPRLPSTLPNAAVPRGKGPSFLQVLDIQLAPPAGQAQAPDILGGLNDWEEEQVMAALQGRPPVPQPEDLRPQPGLGGGSQLTAAEALGLEPGYAQQYQLEVLRRRRAQRKAAVAERRQRYQAGLQHFADPSQPLRPLHLPPPEYQMPLPGDARPGQDTPTRAPASGRPGREEGVRAGWNAGGGGGHGQVRGPLWGDATHGSLFPPQPTYLTGPGIEAQPHPRSPLQRRMHGDARPRKRWSQQRERQPSLSPQAMAMLQHQRTFTSRVRSATRSPRPGRESGHATGRNSNPATRGRAGGVTFADEEFGNSPGYRRAAGAVGEMEGTTGRVPYMARVGPNAAAVRSLAAMVAHRLERVGYGEGDLMRIHDGGITGREGEPGVELYYAGGGEEGEEGEEDEGGSEDWDGEEDELGMGTECGGCDFDGCPVHGSAARRRDAAAASTAAKRARTGGERPQGRAEQDRADDAVDEEVRQRSQREMHRAVMLDQWMTEMRELNAATARAEATRSVAVASAQQALAARREQQAAELAGIFNLLGEVDALANDMEQQTRDTKKMMQALEEEAELRQVSRLNSLLMEARRLGGQVDAALQPGQGEGQGQGTPGGAGSGGPTGGSAHVNSGA